MSTEMHVAMAQGENVNSAAATKAAKTWQRNLQQAVVLEVISDPKQITPEKIFYWKNILKVDSDWTTKYLSAPSDKDKKDFPRIFPRNTIIIQKKLIGGMSLATPAFALPFFPSHLSMPCKTGELVWVIYENPNAGGEKIPYWMCSVVQPYFIEDVNHTHAPMALRQSTLPKSAPADLKMPYELRNGNMQLKPIDAKFVDDKNNPLITSDTNTAFLSSSDPYIFEKLIKATDASKITSYESIPRFHKRPGDIVLEGSNNTLIALGIDRTGPIGDYVDGVYVTKKENISTGLSPEWPDEDYKQYAGSIDIVAGRGYSPETGGKKDIKVTEISNPKNVIKNEIDKLNPPKEEGDPDFINDRSRILISQKTNIDKNFNLEDYFSTTPGAPANVVDTERGDSAIVIKSDKVRIIARSDISFIVTNFEEKVPTAEDRIDDIYKNEVEDATQWASITIRRNGDIIFKPSNKGLIKLGGDDADKAILCTDNLAPGAAGKPIVKDGVVSYKPGLISTGADLLGTGKPKQGTFATKVLIK